MSVQGRAVLDVPAKPEYLLLARLAVTGVGRSAGSSEETIADLKLAITEAVANAVKHAYPDDAPGRITVELEATTGALEIAVSDTGRGVGVLDEAPSGDDEPGEGGMGLSIIRAVADEVELTAGPGGVGTRVRFTSSF
jgi:serine/threonine-protein kinase RsbW